MSDTKDNSQHAESPSSGDSVRSIATSRNRDAGVSSVPDHADFETERAVLGSILLDPATLNSVATILGGSRLSESIKTSRAKSKQKPATAGSEMDFSRVSQIMFRNPVNALIYEAVLSQHAKFGKSDILSVCDYLQRAGKLELIGGMDALLDLQNAVGNVANIEAWCHILKDYAMLREMVRVCSNAMELCRNVSSSDVKSVLDMMESNFFQVRNGFVDAEQKDMRTNVHEAFQYLVKLQKGEIEPGLSTGYPDLDHLIGGGLKKQEMCVLAARPSIGKTALALNIVRNVVMKEVRGESASKRKRVAFFSLEMSAEQVTQRLLCTEARVPLSTFMERNFDLSNDITKLSSAASNLARAHLHIDATGGLSIFELRAKARKLSDQFGHLDLVVIDYLQLMKADEVSGADNRQVEVATISGGIKKLAKDLDVPVLVLAQVNREVEKAGTEKNKNPRPKLSNLRESGAIEQDADIVVFLHRNRDETKEAAGASSNAEGARSELIVEKNRNGRTGIVEVRFFPSVMEFRSVDHRYSADDRPRNKQPGD